MGLTIYTYSYRLDIGSMVEKNLSYTCDSDIVSLR
uniref:Uncharacterized protein n=1 Tax=Siphoviridae sp. ctLdn10 TaxID=2827847 RepID=A0A8S5SQ10_9CAUD|nr:MAG TPA: hypothetical protein [Siphoviridae sp. ctLdn10]